MQATQRIQYIKFTLAATTTKLEGCGLGNNSVFAGDDEGEPVGSMAKLPQLFTLAEVAKALALSPHTVRAFVRRGKLHPIRICRRLLFNADELTKFIDAAK